MLKVTIYSTPTCPYCEMAKEFFKKNGIVFSDFDVSRDEEKAREMVMKSHQMGVPVIDIDGTIVVGFDRPTIEKVLGLKK